ncbi:TetR/AcrR family transcriptional regulator [Dactylosporangium sp. NPDC051485]|uniref:TetR/AcrR family transcriptional regulator n=1 Tax=Dactylosporangium sp. NPDC051485 TaxID=3154846 RepID=UPI00344551EB
MDIVETLPSDRSQPVQPQDRRSLILQKAAELFAIKGVSATTVREIADVAGVLSGTLYHYFGSKDDMVAAIVIRYLEDLNACYGAIAADIDPAEQFVRLVEGSLSIIESHPYAMEIYQNSGKYLHSLASYDKIRQAVGCVQRRWFDLLEAGVAAGVFRSDVPPRVLHRLVRDALWLSVRWFTPTEDYTTRQLAANFVSVFLQGIRRDGAAAGTRVLPVGDAVLLPSVRRPPRRTSPRFRP